MSLLKRMTKAVNQNPVQILKLPGYTIQYIKSQLEIKYSDKVYKSPPLVGDFAEILKQLRVIGIEPEIWEIDKTEFKDFIKAVDYEKRKYYPVNTRYFWEKSLEHYLSIKMLQLEANDVFMDVASDKSVFPEIVKDLYGCKFAYRQDLIYDPGIHGDKIGGNAADMPVPGGFATKLVLHNAFEHFEGDSDSGFISEAARVLKPKGRFVIIPLFVGLSYFYRSSYFRSRKNVPIDPNAKWYIEKGLLQRHSRFYDIQQFKNRILDYANGFDIKVFYMPNVRDIHPICDCDFALLGIRK